MKTFDAIVDFNGDASVIVTVDLDAINSPQPDTTYYQCRICGHDYPAPPHTEQWNCPQCERDTETTTGAELAALSARDETEEQIQHEIKMGMRRRFVNLYAGQGAIMAFAISLEKGSHDDCCKDILRGRVTLKQALQMLRAAVHHGVIPKSVEKTIADTYRYADVVRVSYADAARVSYTDAARVSYTDAGRVSTPAPTDGSGGCGDQADAAD